MLIKCARNTGVVALQQLLFSPCWRRHFNDWAHEQVPAPWHAGLIKTKEALSPCQGTPPTLPVIPHHSLLLYNSPNTVTKPGLLFLCMTCSHASVLEFSSQSVRTKLCHMNRGLGSQTLLILIED